MGVCPPFRLFSCGPRVESLLIVYQLEQEAAQQLWDKAFHRSNANLFHIYFRTFRVFLKQHDGELGLNQCMSQPSLRGVLGLTCTNNHYL